MNLSSAQLVARIQALENRLAYMTPITAFKTGNTTYTGTGLTSDPDLLLSGFSPSAFYQITGQISYFSAITNTDLAFQFSGTGGSGATLDLGIEGPSAGGFNFQGTLNSTQTITNPTGGNNYSMKVFGYFATGTVPGIQMKFAKVNNTQVNVNRGSYLVAVRLG